MIAETVKKSIPQAKTKRIARMKVKGARATRGSRFARLRKRTRAFVIKSKMKISNSP